MTRVDGDRRLSGEISEILDEKADLSAAFALVQAGIFIAIVDDNRLIYTNAAFDRMLHTRSADLSGTPWHDFVCDDAERDSIRARIERDGTIDDHEISFRRDDGEPVLVRLSAARIPWGGGEVVFGSLVDLTPLKTAEAEVRLLADQDSLTGLPNPRCIRERLERALSRARRHDDGIAVMFVDLDRFKAVNDTFGHAVGDTVLKTVAQRLRDIVRDCDTVGRMGGDEFVLMLTDIADPAILSVIAQRAVDAIAAPIDIDGGPVHVGASIGVASFPEHGDDVDMLLRRADQAMYAVKRAGKNSFRVAA